MKIVNDGRIINESDPQKFCSSNCIDTEEILCNVRSLRETYGIVSPWHSVYLKIIQDIQVDLIERLQHDQFDEPYFVASTTAHFVQEIRDDLQDISDSRINKLIAKFQLENPRYEERVISSKLDMRIFYSFLVNQMSDLEDRLRAKAIAKSGKVQFTPHDKNQIINALTSVIYQNLETVSFSKNRIGVYLEKLSEKLIKLVIRYICLIHINKSILIANSLIQN